MKGIFFLLGIFVFSLHVNAMDFAKESSYQNACDSGDGQSCLKLGAMYHSGDGVGQSFSHAKELYTDACDVNVSEGCLNLGFMYGSGQLAGGFQKAVDYYQKACTLENDSG